MCVEVIYGRPSSIIKMSKKTAFAHVSAAIYVWAEQHAKYNKFKVQQISQRMALQMQTLENLALNVLCIDIDKCWSH